MRYQPALPPKGFFLALLVSLLFAASTAKDDDILWAKLSNGKDFPLVGLGVGNLQHEIIADRIEKALANDKKTILFDTAHASKNEGFVLEGIVNGIKASKNPKLEVHVVTKVWYTHLGYERTKIAVKESLEMLNHPNIKLHILIHWPRCNDDIPWMNCEEEENELPSAVKKAGPPPHLNKDTAFLESWKALEDIYTGKVKLGKRLPQIESIGVSNFALDDFKALEKVQRISPSILQGNVWSYVFDPFLIDYCEEHKILFQSFNSVNGVFYDRGFEDAPNAILALNDLKDELSEMGGANYTLPQLVLKWLVQNDVSVIPRTSNIERLAENSAVSIASMPNLDDTEQDTINSAVAGLLTKEDIKPPLAEWVNLAEKVMSIFWVHAETGEEVPVVENLAPGETYNAYTQRGHTFKVYYEGSDVGKVMTVNAQHGQNQRFDIKGEEEL